MILKSDYSFDLKELLALCTMMLLAPLLRLVPSGAASVAGRGAWLTALAAAPLVLAYVFFICRLMKGRNENEGLGELCLRCLGGKAGKGVLLVSAAWFVLYAGFILRSGADRLITTIYPHSTPHIFIIVMGLLGLFAAMGSCRSIARTAKLVQPMVLGVLLFVLIFSLASLQKENLLPISRAYFVPIMKGSLSVTDILCVVLYLSCFLMSSTRKDGDGFKSYCVWAGLMLLVVTAVSSAVVGNFGAELTARLTRPFFSLVRNLVFFGSLERIEALVVTLWVFPDFLLVSALLYAAQHILRLCFDFDPGYRGEKRRDISSGRWLALPCGAAAMLCAMFIARNPAALELWSKTVIPIINLCYAFVFLPVIYLVGSLRRKLG